MRDVPHLLEDTIAALFHYPGPVVAFVNGHAIAGGCILALCCDLRVVAPARGSSSGSTRWRSGCGSRGGSCGWSSGGSRRRASTRSCSGGACTGRTTRSASGSRTRSATSRSGARAARPPRPSPGCRLRAQQGGDPRRGARRGSGDPPRVPGRGAALMDRAGPARAPAGVFGRAQAEGVSGLPGRAGCGTLARWVACCWVWRRCARAGRRA
jgi:hypothetical protein